MWTQKACLWQPVTFPHSLAASRTASHAASLNRFASFDRVARLNVLPEPLAAWMIEFHDIPRFSMFIMAVLRFLSSGRPRYLPTVFLGNPLHLTPAAVVVVLAGNGREHVKYHGVERFGPVRPASVPRRVGASRPACRRPSAHHSFFNTTAVAISLPPRSTCRLIPPPPGSALGPTVERRSRRQVHTRWVSLLAAARPLAREMAY
jgi:hypothetical protein